MRAMGSEVSSSIRVLGPPPRAFLNPSTGRPAFGSFAGALPRVEIASVLGTSPRLETVFRRKKWVWLAVTTDEIWLSLAIVRMGYAASASVFVFDVRTRAMLVDRTFVAAPFAADVADDPHASGALAHFRQGRSRMSVKRRGATLHLVADLSGLAIDAIFDDAAAPPPIAAIAPLADSANGTSLSATEKSALASVRGSLFANGRRFPLDGGFGGYDYTHGLMPRHTRWNWAFAMGRTERGEAIGFNVVEGFVGEAECAAFFRGAVLPLGEPRFEFDAANPAKPWRLVGPGMALTFDVGAIHVQNTNLGLARSRFVQPVGTFRGALVLDGEDVRLDRVLGVVEDQDVLW